jgi:Na+-transporting methylmalonyl-CoA/oxaloacetate decarboxylase gamma subunit
MFSKTIETEKYKLLRYDKAILIQRLQLLDENRNVAVVGVCFVFGFLPHVYFHVKLLIWLINTRCGAEHDRDINVTVNILRVGASTLKEEDVRPV